MKMRSSSVAPGFRHLRGSYKLSWAGQRSAFTLVEMLLVLAITGILSSLLMASFSSIIGGGFNQTVSDMSDTMEQARAYAMANNTYVYVGITEVDANTSAAGNGTVVMAIAASKDGTDGFNGSTNPANWAGNTDLVAISKLRLFHNVHLATSEVAKTGNLSRPTSASDPSYFIGSASLANVTQFTWPLGSASATYTFSKVVRFGPQGDATILQTSSGVVTVPAIDWIELDVQPIHGNAVTSVSSTNVSAIQIDGMTGTVRSYRP